jgi:signal transduction histidine kinase
MSTPAKAQLRRSTARTMPFTPKSFSKAPIAGKNATRKEPLAAIAHDTRNVVAALRLYCDLLAEPGVLSEGHQHYAAELQAIAAASSGLVEQLAALGLPSQSGVSPASATPPVKMSGASAYIDDLTLAVRRLEGPLATMAGEKIDLHVETLPCPGRVRLSQESLTRILINLTRNAAEAMQQGGCIRITLQQGDGGNFLDHRKVLAQTPRTVLLCVQDSGPGVPERQMPHLFDAGFTTKGSDDAAHPASAHRGLGLSIVRHLAESAGGCVRAISVAGRGARFEVELPLIFRTRSNNGFVADFTERANIEC